MEKQTTEPEPIAVDTRTAMRMLSLGRSSILNLADRGDLPRIRLGRSVRYSVSDIEALVTRRRAASQAAAGAGPFRLTPPGQAE